MWHLARWILVTLAVTAMVAPHAAAAEPRIALVLGNAAYARGPISSSLADAGLVAEALNGVGFEILEGADLEQADLRRTFRDFLARVDSAGPGTTAFVYFSGYALEFEGENYLVPIDARLASNRDIPLEAVRISDVIHALAGSAARAAVVVLDAVRPLPLTMEVAPGLAPMEAPPGMLVAFASAPGTFAEDGADAYGAYASAIAEMIREGGLDLDTMFARIRVRTHELTAGRQTPWHVASLPGDVVLAPGTDSAAAGLSIAAAPQGIAGAAPRLERRPPRPMSELDPDEAYGLAIEADTLPTYVEYVETYPDTLYAPRIWAIIRARREALAFRRALDLDTREAYWTYLHRYPNGIYAGDAQRRLRRLAAFTAPPPGFAPIELVGVPPPLAREPRDYVRVHPPLPRLPQGLIGPRPAYFSALAPPPPAPGPRLLPVPGGLPRLPRVGPPPRRFGPPVGVVTPGLAPAVAPAAIPSTAPAAPAGPAGAVPPRYGTGTPGGQPAARPAEIAPVQPAPRRFGTGAVQPGAAPVNPQVAPGPQRVWTGTPPQGVHGAVPVSPRIVTPPPQQPIYPRGAPAGPAPAARIAPSPPPAAVARPVPPVIQRPPAAAFVPPQRHAPAQARGAPAGRKCPIVNGVARCS